MEACLSLNLKTLKLSLYFIALTVLPVCLYDCLSLRQPTVFFTRVEEGLSQIKLKFRKRLYRPQPHWELCKSRFSPLSLQEKIHNYPNQQFGFLWPDTCAGFQNALQQ